MKFSEAVALLGDDWDTWPDLPHDAAAHFCVVVRDASAMNIMCRLYPHQRRLYAETKARIVSLSAVWYE